MNKWKTILATTVLSSVAFGTVAAENCGPAFDSLTYLADASGSMMQKSTRTDDIKADVAKNLIKKLAMRIAGEGSTNVELSSLAPYAELIPMKQYSGADFARAVDDKFNTRMEVFGRPTWMGKRAAQRLTSAMGNVGAVVLATDGGFTEHLENPLQVFEKLGSMKPRKSIYIWSLAENTEQKAQVQKLAEVTGAEVFDAYALSSDEKVFESFVNDKVLIDCGSTEPMTIELQGIGFVFDSDVLTAESIRILEGTFARLSALSLENREMRLVGWTDAVGSKDYNLRLSERRASAVKTWFEKKGMKVGKITAVGQGISHKYANDTAQGRAKNRRVDIELTAQ